MTTIIATMLMEMMMMDGDYDEADAYDEDRVRGGLGFESAEEVAAGGKGGGRGDDDD